MSKEKKCDCGKETRVHYDGKEYCDECFYNVYTKPLLMSMTDEERERAVRINRNFIRRRELSEEERAKLKNTLYYQSHMLMLAWEQLKAIVECKFRPKSERAKLRLGRVRADIRSLETKPELLFDL